MKAHRFYTDAQAHIVVSEQTNLKPKGGRGGGGVEGN